jgi:hypothetical protein
MRRLWLTLIGTTLASAALATPWFTQDPRTLPAGRWRVEEHVLYAPFEDSLVDGDRTPLTAVRDFSALTLHTRVRYGLRDDVTVFVDIPWVSKRATTNDGGKLDNDGLGDLLVLVKGKYYDNKAERSRRAWALALKLDTGDVEGLPPALATGSGTTDITVSHLWEKGMGDATYYAGVGYTNTGSRSDLHRNPGDVLFANLAGEHKLGGSPWNLVWELNGRYEGNTTGAAATTGATTVSLSPGLQYVRPGKQGKLLQLEAGVQVPVLMWGDAPAIPEYTAYAGGYIVF